MIRNALAIVIFLFLSTYTFGQEVPSLVIEDSAPFVFEDAICLNGNMYVSSYYRTPAGDVSLTWERHIRRLSETGAVQIEESYGPEVLPEGTWFSYGARWKETPLGLSFAALMVDFGEQPDSLEYDTALDTTYLYVRHYSSNLSLQSETLTALSSVPHELSDLRYDAENEQFVCSLNLLFYNYRLATVDLDGALTGISSVEVNENFISENDRQYPIILHAGMDEYLVRRTSHHLHRYSGDNLTPDEFEFEEIDFATPHLSSELNQGVIESSNSFYASSYGFDPEIWDGIPPYVVKAGYDGSYIDEFWFSNPDSTIEGSLHQTLVQTEGNNLLLGMHIRKESEDNVRHFKVIKADTLGNLIWQRVFGEGDVRYEFMKILELENGSIAVFGERFPIQPAEGDKSIVLFLLDEQGGIVSDINENSSIGSVKLYPNPFEDQLRVQSTESIIRISLSSILGKEVYRIENPETNHTLNLGNLESGIYHVEVVTRDQKILKTVVKR